MFAFSQLALTNTLPVAATLASYPRVVHVYNPRTFVFAAVLDLKVSLLIESTHQMLIYYPTYMEPNAIKNSMLI